jgi:hypothetical protein
MKRIQEVCRHSKGSTGEISYQIFLARDLGIFRESIQDAQ